MAGRRYIILPKTQYVMNAVASSTTDMIVAKAVPSADWVTGVVLVRMYAKGTFNSATPVIDVRIGSSSIPEDEPQTFFASVSGAHTIVSVGSSFVPPTLFVSQMAGPFGGQTSVTLRWNQGITAGSCDFTIGIELIGRDA